MPNLFINEEVDIYTLPYLSKIEGNQVSIGDLHGNAIKLLFMLVKHGIVTNITEQNYQKLVEIYKTPVDELKKEDLAEFNNLLANVKFNSNGLKVRLLGDEFADRGNNDYFTLKILQKLAAAQVPFEIILSNHSVEFIEAYEKQDKFYSQRLFFGQAGSMQRLQELVDKGLVSGEEILTIINKAYKPSLRAISYSLNQVDNEITIFSHAAIGLNTIERLAKELNVDYKAATAAELAQTIDDINEEFQKYVQSNAVSTLYTPEDMEKCSNPYDLSDMPFVFIMWNRCYDHIDRPADHYGYKLSFVHGHDPYDPRQEEKHVHNLDNCLGKGENQNKGKYTILTTDTGVVIKKEENVNLSADIDASVLVVQKPTQVPTTNSLTDRQISAITHLLSDYLAHLCSHSYQFVDVTCVGYKPIVEFKDKDSDLFGVFYLATEVAAELDEKTYVKFNKTCDLLIKLHNNDGTFQTEISNDDTVRLLSAHRSNRATTILKAICYILTLGCVTERNFFFSRGKQVIEEVKPILSPLSLLNS